MSVFSNRLYRGAIVGLLIASTGCATIATGGGPSQQVRIASAPPGAKIYLDNDFKGNTPSSIAVTRKDTHQIRLELAGYVTASSEVKPGMNPWFLGNILLGGVIGALVDVFSGAIVSPNPTDVNVKLTPAPSASAVN